MKTFTTWLFLLTLLMVGNIVYAQMGIGTTSPAPSSMLDITSNVSGVLIPRMTEAQRLAITNPETSLLVFQTDGVAGFYFNDGSPASPDWRLLGTAGESWLLAGNALSGTEYFGSTNLQPVKFYANGTEYMRLTESGNLGIGTTSPMAKLEVAGYLQFDDDLSTYMGYQAGAADPSGLGNTGVGVRALYSLTTGEFNSAFGHVALTANLEGYDNSAFGVAAMNSNNSGSENSAFGAFALSVNSEGNGNTAMGHSAIYNNQDGDNNTAVGSRSLFENLTGSYNTSVGYESLNLNISGQYNTVIGTRAGYENTTGSENTFIGPKSGDNNTTGSKNIAIGSQASLPDGTMDGQMVLGDQYTLFGDLLNSRIGIGTTAPTNKLHVVVEGDPLRLQGLSNSTETDVLVVDATGVVAKRGGTFGSFWSLNGNTLVGTEILGSVNASPLILYTNNTGRLGIHSNGHVGIPEPSPESLFEINGVDDEVQFIIRAADPQSNPNSLLQLRNKSNDILCALHSDDPTNVFLGTDAGRSNTLVPFSKEGRTNIFIGNGSGLYNGMGYQNIGFGYQSLYNQEHGFGNIAIGHEAGFGGSILNPETFNGNILLGYRAGYGLRENGDDNILIGNECGSTISIGNRNILIGNSLQPTSSTATRQLIIGSQTLLFGNMVSEFIGIGVTAPTHKLHVSSTANPLRLDGLQTTSQSDVLVVDANGVVSKRNGGFGTSWSITGNSGTDPANNFIGTTDSQPLVIKVNNNPAGRISPLVGQNLSFGYRALATNLGSRNTALGDHSMYVIEAGGDDNTAAGYRALHLIQQGDANSAFGTQSLYSNSSGVSNTGLGYHALYSNTTGNNNVAVGYASMSLGVTGSDNAALGIASLRSNTNGGNNTAIGGQSLYNITSGGSNVAVGFEAGFGATGSVFQNNVMIGRSAGLRLDDGGNNNILIGYTAGAFLTTGQNNIVIGYNVDAPSPTGSYQMVIGAQDLLYGNISSKLVGIGTTAPTNKLHVVAASNPLRLEGLQTTTNTDVLVVSSTGVVSKTSMPGGNLWTRSNSKTYLTNVADNVGIGTSNPTQKLEVNGTVRIGANGSTITNIIKTTVTIDVPNVPIAGFVDVTFSVSNAATTSTVYVSPQNTLANGMGIVSARVVSAGNVEVRFVNFDLSGTAHDLPSMDYYVTVIQ